MQRNTECEMHLIDPVLQDRLALIDQTNGLTGCISKQNLMFLRVSLKKPVSLWLVTYNASYRFPYLRFTNTMNNNNNYTQIKYKTHLTCLHHHCRCCLVPKVWWIITSLSLSLMQQLQKEIRIVSTSSIHNVLYSIHAPVHKLWSNCKNVFPDVCAINSEAIAKNTVLYVDVL